ncbi:MAG: ABC transporter ATP-binding protein [Oscillospiraceae bacterium]|nr:ABC transporter ATP-binding protein [Oscillospiraceae bacterium]
MAEERNHKQPPRRGPHGGPPGGPPGAPVEKAKDFKGTMGRLLRYIGNYKFAVLLACVFAAVSTVFSVRAPKVLGEATTELYNGIKAMYMGTGGIDFGAIAKILIVVMVLYGISVFCSFVQSYTMTTVVQNLSYRLRKEITEKIGRMPMKYFEKRTVGEVLSRITNDVDTLGMGLNQSITTLITSIATLVGVVYMMLSISPLMTGITALMLPLTLVVMMVVIKNSQPHFIAQQRELGELNGCIEETFSGLNVVQAYNREQAVLDEFNATNEKLYEAGWKSQFLSGLMMPLMGFIGNLGYVAVVISGAMLAIRGTIQIGDIQAFMNYVRNFTQPITQLGQVSNQMQSMAAAAERVFAFLAEAEEEPAPAQPVSTGHVEGNVSFRNVKFGYDPGQPVIHDWSCEVKKGETVAIVGPTGAGKTTMVKLLMRFYDVDGGEILLDGVNIKAYDRGELRRQFGMVLQDTWLFKGTIMENIRYGRADATDEEVIAAAKAAHAHKFIRSLPGGYSMELNEDATNVSQGQKQLLTIARAILADSPVLILDEATSSVDTRTEQLIQKGMDTLMEGRTSFVIAHRLSTIRNADRILVMQEGNIVEQGTHDELLSKGGFYSQLWNSQFESAN